MQTQTKLIVGVVAAAASFWTFGVGGTIALGLAFAGGALYASDGSGRYVEEAKRRAQIAAGNED